MSLQIDPTPSAQWLESHPPTFVVGYDGSAEARRALQVAAGRARPGGTVVAVYATPSASESLDSSCYANAVTARLRREDEILGQLANVDLGDVRLDVQLVDGSPAEALVSAARARDALEIVVGSRWPRGDSSRPGQRVSRGSAEGRPAGRRRPSRRRACLKGHPTASTEALDAAAHRHLLGGVLALAQDELQALGQFTCRRSPSGHADSECSATGRFRSSSAATTRRPADRSASPAASPRPGTSRCGTGRWSRCREGRRRAGRSRASL